MKLARRRFLFCGARSADICSKAPQADHNTGNMTLFATEQALYLECFQSQDQCSVHHFQSEAKTIHAADPVTSPATKKAKIVLSAAKVITSDLGDGRYIVYLIVFRRITLSMQSNMIACRGRYDRLSTPSKQENWLKVFYFIRTILQQTNGQFLLLLCLTVHHRGSSPFLFS